MKTNNKPDLLKVLAIIVGLGVVVSMYSQRAPFNQSAPNAFSQSSTTIKNTTQHESHPLDPNTLVKVNETLQRKQQQDNKRPIGSGQPRTYQF
jgi:hypothetical protein